MTYPLEGEKRSRALQAALELVEAVCRENMAIVMREPDIGLYKIGAEAGNVDTETAQLVYDTMLEAQR